MSGSHEPGRGYGRPDGGRPSGGRVPSGAAREAGRSRLPGRPAARHSRPGSGQVCVPKRVGAFPAAVVLLLVAGAAIVSRPFGGNPLPTAVAVTAPASDAGAAAGADVPAGVDPVGSRRAATGGVAPAADQPVADQPASGRSDQAAGGQLPVPALPSGAPAPSVRRGVQVVEAACLGDALVGTIVLNGRITGELSVVLLADAVDPTTEVPLGTQVVTARPEDFSSITGTTGVNFLFDLADRHLVGGAYRVAAVRPERSGTLLGRSSSVPDSTCANSGSAAVGGAG